MNRSLAHWIVRGPRQNHLSTALAALRGAIREHRSLLKLAPSRFDFGIVRYNEKHREERRRWAAVWQPILDKVYGPDTASEGNSGRCSSGAKTVPTSGFVEEPFFVDREEPQLLLRTQAIQLELEIGLQTAGEAMKRWERLQRGRMTFKQLARLIDTGIVLGRLASGVETKLPAELPDPSDHSECLAALNCVYGS